MSREDEAPLVLERLLLMEMIPMALTRVCLDAFDQNRRLTVSTALTFSMNH